METLDGYTIRLPRTGLTRLIPRLRMVPRLWRRILINRTGALEADIGRFLRRAIEAAESRGRSGRGRLFAVELDGIRLNLLAKPVAGRTLALTGIRPAGPREAEFEADREDGDYAADNIHAMKLIFLKNQLERLGWDVRDNRDLRPGEKSRPDLVAQRGGRKMLIEVDTDPHQSKRHQQALSTLEPGTRSLYYVIDPRTGQTLASSAYNPKPGATQVDPGSWYHSRRIRSGPRGIRIDRRGTTPMPVPLDVLQARAVLDNRTLRTAKTVSPARPRRRIRRG